MQFRVPQFIDIEDKILGPLSWKQFAYCLGAAGIIYIGFRFIESRILALIAVAPFAGILLSFAFVKINNQTFVDVANHAVGYFTSKKLYTWRKVESPDFTTKNIVSSHTPSGGSPVKKKTRTLKELSTELDTRPTENNEAV
jgi:hypothetical protein